MTQNNESKIFNDPIHGSISFNSACVAIIDTPEFQRLRHLKQLGAGYWVYPGAGHNRFEHSLGVCYLAGQFVRHLQENQKELEITDQDVLCVEIAGLCHDLGHGPFSHTFDGKFIPSVLKKKGVKPEETWKHEDASKKLFRHLVEKYKLIEVGGALYEHKFTKDDVLFITELISPEASGPSEIVANKRNGIDVDKFDYLTRDCYQLGIRNNFDHKRFIKFTRVIEVDGQWQICLRDKEVLNLYNMFMTRYTLHKVAYKHEVVCAIDMMVADALIKSDDHILIKNKNGDKLKMSKCIDDMEAYTQLNDSIIFKILYTESDHKDMEEARELIQRVFRRDLYKCVYESPPIDPKILGKKKEEDIKREIIEIGKAASTPDELVVEIVKLDFGKGFENPMESLNVFSKDNLDSGRHLAKLEVSRVMAFNYAERLVRVYTRRARLTTGKTAYEQHIKEINEAVKKLFEKEFPEEVRADCVPIRPEAAEGAQVPTSLYYAAVFEGETCRHPSSLLPSPMMGDVRMFTGKLAGHQAFKSPGTDYQTWLK